MTRRVSTCNETETVSSIMEISEVRSDVCRDRSIAHNSANSRRFDERQENLSSRWEDSNLKPSPHLNGRKGLDFGCKRSVSVAAIYGPLGPYLDPAPLAMPPLWGFGGDGAACHRNRKDPKCCTAKPAPKSSSRAPRGA